MKLTVLMIMSLLCLPLWVQAQERTAAQGYDAQVNWSALRNQIDLVNNQNKILAGMLDAMRTCNTLNKLYNPSSTTPVPDGHGCVSVSSPLTLVTVDSNGGNWAYSPTGVMKGDVASRTATCPAGTVVIGGSCDMDRHADDGREIQPRYCKMLGNGFYCSEGNTGYCIAHAVCAKQ